MRTGDGRSEDSPRAERSLGALFRVRRLDEDRKLKLVQLRRAELRDVQAEADRLADRRKRVAGRTTGDLLANRKLAETLSLMGRALRKDLAVAVRESDAQLQAFRDSRIRRRVIERLMDRRERVLAKSRSARDETEAIESSVLWNHVRKHAVRGGRS